MKNLLKNNSVIIVTILLGNTLWLPQGISQIKNPNDKKDKEVKEVKKFITNPPTQYFPMTMPTPVSLPNVPVYPGKPKYNGGSAYTNDPNATRYMMHYLAKEPPSQIIQWYKAALCAPTWTISSSQNNFIEATDKNGNTCSVEVSTFGKGSQFNLSYTAPKTGP